VTTSEAQQFCKTSSIFELDNVEKRSNSATDGLVPMRFAIPPLHVSKVLRLPRKSDARSLSAAPVTQNHLSKPEGLMLQNPTPRRKSAP